MSYYVNRFGLIALAIIAVVVSALLNAIDYGVWIALGLLLLVLVQYMVRLAKIENAIPVLVIADPYISRFGVGIFGTSAADKAFVRGLASTAPPGSIRLSISSATADSPARDKLEYRGAAGNFDFALADVSNEPREVAGDTTARWVTAQGVFYTLDGKVIAPAQNSRIFLRWWSEPEPLGGNLRVHRRVDIPHGNPVILGMAFKKVGEDSIFAYDVGSHGQEDLKKKGTALGRGTRIARITLGGDNVKNLVTWYELKINQNRALEIAKIDEPAWHRGK